MASDEAVRLARSIEAIVATADEAGHTVDVARVAAMLVQDLGVKIAEAEVYRMVAEECARHPGVAVVLNAPQLHPHAAPSAPRDSASRPRQR